MPPSLSAAIGISTLGLSGALWAAGSPNLSTEIVAEGLEHPWAVAFLPDGRYLVTERPGRMRIVQGDGRLGAPLAGLPAVEAAGQGGLLDVVLDSDFARNRQLYFCYSEPGSGADSSKNSTALASARLSDDASRLEQVKVLFSQRPKYASALHFGCRIVERMVEGKSDGTLFLALGERSRYKEEAQNLKSHLGKIVRIAKDGSVPGDNPFAGRADAWPEIWSYGHRNAQGAALAPDGSLWMHEHGPQGGDEVNRPEPGKNYGWPVITYGENYGGGKIGAGITRKEGMEQPQHYWVPSIAPSGMAFVTSDRYGPQWKGSLVVGSLKFQRLERLTVRSGKVTASEQVLPRLGQRVRDVRQGPDGWLYLLTDAQDGQLLRVTATP
ncbi:PQQ-dependent sugar dehydrogenase [Delftia acidovorans]|uniref:PQQ-dependent sugar dehydrogenase n=1 Tax=Delftia acidovorans TaxID=80866 RepID=UPI001EFDE20D|nr:PQQ-dependent sugar dehydrogenase [Delftia acidovorans]MCG8985792.1 PQQ-dependent sugar dehydrogenase [Delftia acidovorans]